MNIFLDRYESTQNGTFGRLVAGDLILQTIERPWLNNKPFESCIPQGTYQLKPFTRSNGDNVYALINSEKRITEQQTENSRRYAILIHAGNYMEDVVGCIAPGLTRNGNMVTHSRKAMGELMKKLAGQENQIIINFEEVV